MRAERSAAIMLRARFSNVARNDVEKPRTPVSAATPMATERMTKKNFPREDRISLAAILAAERKERVAMLMSSRGNFGWSSGRAGVDLVRDNQAVAQNDAAIRVTGEHRVVGYQHQ